MNSIDRGTVYDAYVYLLGRALVVRQERADLSEPGIDHNVIKHNPVGRPLEWVNPNLDVTNSEAWIGIDADTPVLLDIPRIQGRYHTVQILDEWGEVITNINERNYPDHAHGLIAFTSLGSRAPIPADAVPIRLRSPKAKLLARVELGVDSDGAAEQQHRMTLRSLGSPSLADPIDLPEFDNRSLIGVELFDHADELLASAPDVSPVAAQLQAKVRDVASWSADPARRDVLDAVIRTEVIPAFQRFAVEGAGTSGNNWIATTVIGTYGDDVAIRTAANYVGIWANTRHEVVYYITTRDAEPDGSLRIVLASRPPMDVSEANWLPTPSRGLFSLTFRAYVPKERVRKGQWFPPAVTRKPDAVDRFPVGSE